MEGLASFHTVLYLAAHEGSTLNAFGEISEVEEIVGLGWSGQQVGAHATVDLNAAGI